MNDERAKEIVKMAKSGMTFKEIGEKFGIGMSYTADIYHSYTAKEIRKKKATEILNESGLKDKLVIYKGEYAYSSKYHTDQRDIGYLRISDGGYISFYHFGKNSIDLSMCRHNYPIDDFELLPNDITEYINDQLNKRVDKVSDLENKIAKTERLLNKYKAELKHLREEETNE